MLTRTAQQLFSRRGFMNLVNQASKNVGIRSFSSTTAAGAAAFTLPELPWNPSDLAKYMSTTQLDYHYNKHHRNYVNKVNEFAEKEPALKNMTIEQVVEHSVKKNNKGLFNNSAQVFNHTFFWNSLSPQGGFNASKCPTLVKKMEEDLGGVESALNAFKDTAVTHFGSGWAWLVVDGQGKLAVKGYHDADSPIAHGETPILALDVWEHAYYLDHKNDRAGFVKLFIEKMGNFEFAEANVKAALKK